MSSSLQSPNPTLCKIARSLTSPDNEHQATLSLAPAPAAYYATTNTTPAPKLTYTKPETLMFSLHINMYNHKEPQTRRYNVSLSHTQQNPPTSHPA